MKKVIFAKMVFLYSKLFIAFQVFYTLKLFLILPTAKCKKLFA